MNHARAGPTPPTRWGPPARTERSGRTTRPSPWTASVSARWRKCPRRGPERPARADGLGEQLVHRRAGRSLHLLQPLGDHAGLGVPRDGPPDARRFAGPLRGGAGHLRGTGHTGSHAAGRRGHAGSRGRLRDHGRPGRDGRPRRSGLHGGVGGTRRTGPAHSSRAGGGDAVLGAVDCRTALVSERESSSRGELRAEPV